MQGEQANKPARFVGRYCLEEGWLNSIQSEDSS